MNEFFSYNKFRVDIHLLKIENNCSMHESFFLNKVKAHDNFILMDPVYIEGVDCHFLKVFTNIFDHFISEEFKLVFEAF